MEALQSYRFADEVVVIGGDKSDAHLLRSMEMAGLVDKYEIYTWPKEFKFDFIGKQFQRGYELATGDWVIHADIDFIFHETDYQAIRQAFLANNHEPALSFWKYQFILPDRFTLKSRLTLAVNKGKYNELIKFDSGGDLCQPSFAGNELKIDIVPEARVPIYNYERLLKTEEQLKEDLGRMARAWKKQFGVARLGYDDESAYKEFIEMQVGRFNKPHLKLKIEDHPKVMQDTIKRLKPSQFGYDGLGHLERNSYVKSTSRSR